MSESCFSRSHFTSSSAAPEGELAPLLGRRILLVEDSDDNQEIFGFFLESAGAHVRIVTNGRDAVDVALNGNFDLVLMDIQIPEIDGREAARRLRHRGFQRPIVALTAHAMVEERDACLAAGCDGQLTKPIYGAELIAGVASFLAMAQEKRRET